MKNISCVEHAQCTGCGACYNKCPADAITMEYDSEGFIFPVITQDKCTNCGLCVKSCPEINLGEIKSRSAKNPQCFSMMAENDLRKKSSSGGMFALLAEDIISRGGIVCGAAYSEDYLNVNHIFVEDENSLALLKGSKYLQSDTGVVFRKIKDYLDSGRLVFFTGCPCQVAGLKLFLQSDYENLLTADIVCHGVPSPMVYRKYVEDIGQGRTLQRMDFREKAHWGWGTASSMFFDDGYIYRRDCFTDFYWRAFLGGMSTRQSCSSCKYTNLKRIGDISLGDFWGVSEIDSTITDKQGTGLVVINNDKGKEFAAKVIAQCKHWKKHNMAVVEELAKKRNGQLVAPKNSHWARERFFELLRDGKPFSQAFDDAINSKYDVGVVGWWYNENYGGALTYFSLHQVLRSMGCSVLMIAKSSEDKAYKPNTESVPYRFAQKNYHISKNYCLEDMRCLNNHCRAFISGSDQLFNPILWPWSGPQYFLSFASTDNNLISYASSFGNNFNDPQKRRRMIAYWLRRFDTISVRETYGVDICKNEFDIDAKKVMDPVFLCDQKEFLAQAAKSGIKKKHPYLLNFILDPDEDKRNLILQLSDHLNMQFINLVNADHCFENARLLNLPNTKPNADIEDFLAYYRDADFILTDSFHGTCFAIIFRKQFVAIANKKRGVKRFESILEEAGLLDRLFENIEDIISSDALQSKIDYERVYERLNPKIVDSLNFLRDAIFSPPRKSSDAFYAFDSTIDQMMNQIIKLERLEAANRQKIKELETKLVKSPKQQYVNCWMEWHKKWKDAVKKYGFVYSLKRGFRYLFAKRNSR